MAMILSSLRNTVIAGFVLLIVFLILLTSVFPTSAAWDRQMLTVLFVWAHVISGVMWIGLLYYFNFVQTPSMPKIPDEHKPAISKVIAPTALFWFRWGAMSTIITGLIVAHLQGYLPEALLFQVQPAIGVGMWLAIIMWFNVWFIIWPNQKRVLGLVEASAEVKARSAKIAGQASRINTMLSIPMLLGMVAARWIG
jgi:uncharacterized membrane protein